MVNALTVIESGSREQQTEWFAPERLELRRIQTDACRDLLANLIKYEAVHQIRTLPELLRRLQRDRRCFGLFHPALPLDPLVFTEVALTADVRESVQPILDPDSAVSNPAHARCAVFYSISNCQPALRGLGLGTALLLRAIGELRKELPHLRTFASYDLPPHSRRQIDDAENRRSPSCPRRRDRRPFERGREMIAPKMRSPAPRANAGNRAREVRNAQISTPSPAELQPDFAALYIGRRFRLAMPLAALVAWLAKLAEALS